MNECAKALQINGKIAVHRTSFLDWQFDNVSIPKQSYAMNSLTRGWKLNPL